MNCQISNCNKEATMTVRSLDTGTLEAWCNEHIPKDRFSK